MDNIKPGDDVTISGKVLSVDLYNNDITVRLPHMMVPIHVPVEAIKTWRPSVTFTNHT